MEVRSDAIVGGKKVDQIAGDIERFDGADTQMLDRGFIENSAEKVLKFAARREITAVRAKIDTAKNNLAESGIGELLDFRDDCLRRKAARFSANERDHAKRTARIAAILDL